MTNTTIGAERWRPIPGFEDLHQVSDHGRVRSLSASGAWLIREQRTDLQGYRVITLHKYRGSKNMAVSRAVLLAFTGPCPKGWHACHTDGVKTNNLLSNLRWDTPKGNTADAIKAGTHVSVVERRRAEARRAAKAFDRG